MVRPGRGRPPPARGRDLEDAGDDVSVPVGLRRGVENIGVHERNACLRTARRDWSADTVFGVFGVQVLWRTPDSWGGHDAETALGSGEA
jgi:hypothetical protein